MRSCVCEIVSRLRKTVSCMSHCNRRKSRQLFRIEATIVSRSLGKCNGWLGIVALPSLSRRERDWSLSHRRLGRAAAGDEWQPTSPHPCSTTLKIRTTTTWREGSRRTSPSCRSYYAERNAGQVLMSAFGVKRTSASSVLHFRHAKNSPS